MITFQYMTLLLRPLSEDYLKVLPYDFDIVVSQPFSNKKEFILYAMQFFTDKTKNPVLLFWTKGTSFEDVHEKATKELIEINHQIIENGREEVFAKRLKAKLAHRMYENSILVKSNKDMEKDIMDFILHA